MFVYIEQMMEHNGDFDPSNTSHVYVKLVML